MPDLGLSGRLAPPMHQGAVSHTRPDTGGAFIGHPHPPTTPPAGHPRLTGGLLRGSIRVSSRHHPGRGRTEGFTFAWGYDISDARTCHRVGFVATFAAVSCERDGCFGDLNEDGAVNGADIGLLLGAWGACP
ncbi:MAG: hypothetical protein O3A19_11525 [Planctomycetota bacterium]|nr:hypothetical protein [Planctomycetota bacterium]MDA1027044.1 hypothetical protein [Planctomycetota bacterium]